jgi:hypothetical protein
MTKARRRFGGLLTEAGEVVCADACDSSRLIGTN